MTLYEESKEQPVDKRVASTRMLVAILLEAHAAVERQLVCSA